MTSPPNTIQRVQKHAPFGLIEPKQRLLLRFDAIHPVIRIAHKVEHNLNIAERIIFDHELVLIVRGQTDLSMGGDTMAVHAGDLLFIAPYVPHAFRSTLPNAHVAIHFDFAPGTPRWPEDEDGLKPYEVCWPAGVRIPRLTPVAPGHKIDHLLHDVVARLSDRGMDPLADIDAGAALATVLVDLLRRARSAPTEAAAVDAAHQINRRRMADVLDHMKRNLAQPISLEQLAEIAGISRSRFVTVFRSFTGSSPLHYLLEARVAEARRLLADPSLSIKQVAALTGFEDSLYFSKVFRRIDGLTPSQFRAAAIGGLTDEVTVDEP